MSKKKMIIGIAAGVAVVGGTVAFIVKHNKKKYAGVDDDFYLDDDDDYYGDYADEFWDEDLDDEDEEVSTVNPEIAERVAKYHEAAENLLKELENGTYGK